MSPRAVDKRARPGNEGGPPATEGPADLAEVGQPEEITVPVEAETS
ncbi:hypothetical protein [Kribbella lupini]|uniref:Uncharacterized protein n=1 Tax=Kribbella lupini TaxID=291602 RepID=A0ABN2BII7_9ACTN